MSESSQDEPAAEGRYFKKMLGIIRSHTHLERISALFLRIKARLPDLEELSRVLEEAEEDGIYRFYHGSYKVFSLQEPVKEAFKVKLVLLLSTKKEYLGENDQRWILWVEPRENAFSLEIIF